MKISNELEGQLKRLADQGAFALSHPMKIELKEYAELIGAMPLTNLDCPTCIRNTMHSVNAIRKQKSSTPVLQMKMVNNLNEKKYSELKKLAKEMGLSVGRVSKDELIKAIEDAEKTKK